MFLCDRPQRGIEGFGDTNRVVCCRSARRSTGTMGCTAFAGAAGFREAVNGGAGLDDDDGDDGGSCQELGTTGIERASELEMGLATGLESVHSRDGLRGQMGIGVGADGAGSKLAEPRRGPRESVKNTHTRFEDAARERGESTVRKKTLELLLCSNRQTHCKRRQRQRQRRWEQAVKEQKKEKKLRTRPRQAAQCPVPNLDWCPAPRRAEKEGEPCSIDCPIIHIWTCSWTPATPTTTTPPPSPRRGGPPSLPPGPCAEVAGGRRSPLAPACVGVGGQDQNSTGEPVWMLRCP